MRQVSDGAATDTRLGAVCKHQSVAGYSGMPGARRTAQDHPGGRPIAGMVSHGAGSINDASGVTEQPLRGPEGQDRAANFMGIRRRRMRRIGAAAAFERRAAPTQRGDELSSEVTAGSAGAPSRRSAQAPGAMATCNARWPRQSRRAAASPCDRIDEHQCRRRRRQSCTARCRRCRSRCWAWCPSR